MGTEANQYSTDIVLGSSTPATASFGVGFGFHADRLRIVNDGGSPIRFNLRSTSVASTDDAELKAGEELWFNECVLDGLALTTTSTTTSTAGNGNVVRVQAFGGF